MNTDFKINGQSYRFATSAENVKYGSGTVKDALDDIKSFDTSGMSEFGKKLYAADEKEFKRLLEISSEGIWDEGQTRWQGNAVVTDDTTAHGGKVLSLAGSNLQTAAPVTFGGDPFTISFYLKASPQASVSYFRALGTNRSFSMATIDNKQWALWSGTTAASARVSDTSSSLNNTWQLVKISYNGSTLSINAGGVTRSATVSVPREPRRLVFGNFTGYVDDFELVDNDVLKSALNFE